MISDIWESRRQRDEGIKLVLKHTEESYAQLYRETFWKLAWEGEPFNNEEILALIGPPVRPNASGGLFSGCITEAFKKGLCRVYDERQMSKPSSHARNTKLYIGT